MEIESYTGGQTVWWQKLPWWGARRPDRRSHCGVRGAQASCPLEEAKQLVTRLRNWVPPRKSARSPSPKDIRRRREPAQDAQQQIIRRLLRSLAGARQCRTNAEAGHLGLWLDQTSGTRQLAPATKQNPLRKRVFCSNGAENKSRSVHCAAAFGGSHPEYFSDGANPASWLQLRSR